LRLGEFGRGGASTTSRRCVVRRCFLSRRGLDRRERENLEGRAIGAGESARFGERWRVVGREKAGDLVGVKPSDDGTVGVVHRVVPAFVGWKRRAVFVAGIERDDFLPVIGSQKAEGQTAALLAEQGFDQIGGKRGAVAEENNLLVLFGLAILVGEPSGDVFAGEVVLGVRWLAVLW
jgi:hypothetical protein